jgi:hypothetical protein
VNLFATFLGLAAMRDCGKLYLMQEQTPHLLARVLLNFNNRQELKRFRLTSANDGKNKNSLKGVGKKWLA